MDYGLLDEAGELIENPRAYRCATDQEMEAALQVMDKKAMFDKTGIATMNFNTVFQLYRRVLEGDQALKKARTLLLMPDLLGFLLSGTPATEYTIASTTGLVDVHKRSWSREIMDKLGIPAGIFTPIDQAGHIRGELRADLARELDVPAAKYAAVGTHDTASAVAAIPGRGTLPSAPPAPGPSSGWKRSSRCYPTLSIAATSPTRAPSRVASGR